MLGAMDDKTKSISKNLGGASGASGFLSGMLGGGTGKNSSIAAGGGTYSGGFSAVMGAAKSIGGAALGVGASFANALPTVQQSVTSQLLTSQATFSGMQGNVNGTVKSLMGMGTTSSSTDVQQAIALGTANGVLPGLPGYNSQIMPGVMQLSNLTGSAQSAMQATAALNSGQSVNTLRMMGIQVRGANGAERNPSDIFKDIWNFAVGQSGGKLNASNIAIALQPGNGLANLLDAAAAGDATLRQALQTAALQYAQGGNLSKTSLTQTGQLTSALNSQSALNQSQFGLLSAAAPAEAQGFTEANRLLVKATDSLSKIVTANQGLVKQIAKLETGFNSNIGQSIAGAIASALGGIVGAGGALGAGSLLKKAGSGLLGGIKSLFTGKNLLSDAEQVAAFIGGEFVDPAGGGFIADAAISAGTLSTISGILKGASGGGRGATVSPQTSGIVSAGGASAAIRAGVSQIGTPYVWSGGSIAGPSTSTTSRGNQVGFDCSSFVQYAFAKAGVILPRTTYSQVNCGVAVNPHDAQPGDLLFFDGPANAPGHVAIYMGNNKIIQAPHTGGSVEVVSVDLNTVVAARRVINGATGTAINGNVLTGNRSATTMAGNLSSILSGFTGNGMTGGAVQNINMNELVGYNPTSAMNGGMAGGSGLGQGATSSNMVYPSGHMAKTYLSINPKNGTLETSSNPGGTTITYGDITIPITVPQGSQFDEQKLASLIKKEFMSIGITSKVASS
jgi:cell wall-associated NlpC family hydrolase